MTVHVIVGYGAIGRGAAALLAGQGHEVRVVTRSGGPRDEAAGGRAGTAPAASATWASMRPTPRR